MDKETRGQLALAVQVTRFSLVGALLLGLAQQLLGAGTLLTALLGICGLAYLGGVLMCVLRDSGKSRTQAAIALGLQLLGLVAVFVISPVRLFLSPLLFLGKLLLDLGAMALFMFYLSNLSKEVGADDLVGHFRGLAVTLVAVPLVGFLALKMVPPGLSFMVVLSAGVVMLMFVLSFSGAAGTLAKKLNEA